MFPITIWIVFASTNFFHPKNSLTEPISDLASNSFHFGSFHSFASVPSLFGCVLLSPSYVYLQAREVDLILKALSSTDALFQANHRYRINFTCAFG